MLSRRHLRIKVMQTLYGYSHACFNSMAAGEKELMLSINRYYELFLYQLLFLAEVLEVARRQHTEAKHKHRPTPQDKDTNTKFIDNRLLAAISENKTLLALYKERNISPSFENGIVRRLLSNFKDGSEYKKYMSSEVSNFEKDKEIVAVLVKKYIDDFPPLMQFYEEKSIFWVDDIDMVNFILVKLIRASREEDADNIFPDMKWTLDDDDRQFAIDLFRKTIMGSDKFETLISEKTVNWEMERIAIMDVILMKMAICEILEFPSVPVKVTLNEYIDIAKMYSTPKSGVFVNGILDKLIADFRRTDMINKTGRGLMQ